ncbi:hypothetical protein Tco_1244066 [Tanacetum coccineum]
MRALLIQHGCEVALEVLPAYMEAEVKAELNKKAHSVWVINYTARKVFDSGFYWPTILWKTSTYEYAWWWMEMVRSSKLALVDHHKIGEISSMGSEIMASCEDCLDGEGEVKVESMGGVDRGEERLVGEVKVGIVEIAWPSAYSSSSFEVDFVFFRGNSVKKDDEEKMSCAVTWSDVTRDKVRSKVVELTLE